MINHAKASFSITPRGVFGVGVRLRNVITASVTQRGAGGTTNYEELENLPSINGVILTGNRNVDILNNEIEASIPLGGISQGTVYPEGTSFETILRSLLSPILYPSFTNPSASLTGTGNKLLEAGSTLAVTLTASFNRGSISPAYGTDGYRSGAATGYVLNSGEEQSENTWNETVSSANKTFKVTVNYAEGEQPKDSSGGDYDSPLPAGAVETNTVSYDFVDAMWANTANIAAVAKLSLVAKSTRQRDLTFPAQTVENPEIFDIPASWTVTHVQVKNDLSGQFEDASDQFTVTEVTHEDAGGNTVNYNRYTFSMGFGTGTRVVRIKWS